MQRNTKRIVGKGVVCLLCFLLGGALLVVSQFTLYADIKSRRPGFTKAAPPAVAIPLYETFLDLCRARGFQVEHGAFGADMAVQSVNDGPVTIWMDTETL